MNKKIVYIDMDHVLCDFDKAYKKAKKENPDIKYPQSQYGFFVNLEPMFMAVSAFKILSKRKNLDVYILTAPSEHNPMSYTEKRVWVEKHLGFNAVNKLIISPHKHLNKGDYLIDDNVRGKGQDKFEGILIHFGSKEFPDWHTVLDFFENK